MVDYREYQTAQLSFFTSGTHPLYIPYANLDVYDALGNNAPGSCDVQFKPGASDVHVLALFGKRGWQPVIQKPSVVIRDCHVEIWLMQREVIPGRE